MIQGFGGSSLNRYVTLQVNGLCISGHHGSHILKVSGSALIRNILTAKSINTKYLKVKGNLDVNGTIHAGGDVLVNGNIESNSNVLVGGNVQIMGDTSVNGNIETRAVYLSSAIEHPLQATTKEYVDKFRFIGDVKFSVLVSDHEGWLICDGRSLERSVYSSLFNIIGVQFGSIDSNHFNLPDCRGRVLGASGSGPGLTTRSIGDTVGEEENTLTVDELPSHTHTGTTGDGGLHTHGVTDPGHSHSQTTINDDFNNSGGNPPGFSADSIGSMTWNNINPSTTGVSINNRGLHNHTFETNSIGNGNAFNNMQPTLFIGNLFIFSGVI